MQFQKLSAPSLKDLFISQIKESILSGQLPVGSRIPSERELANQMQVSRAVINSGFDELVHQGFIEIRPRQGVYVTDYARYGNIDTLVAIMEYNGETIRPQEIKSILEFRRAVEHLATDELIRMASQEDMEHIGELTEAIGAAGSISEAVEAAFCFQHGLAMAGGNTILPLIYVSFKPVTSKMWQRFCKRYGIQLLYENTKELYGILRRRDADAARACTDKHLDDIISGEHKIY